MMIIKSIHEIKNLIPFIKPYLKNIYIGGVLFGVSFIIQFSIPLVTRFLIDKVIHKNDLLMLNTICMGILLTICFRYVCMYFQKLNFIKLKSKVIYDIEKRLYGHIQSLPWKYFQKHSLGTIISQHNDVFSIEGLIGEEQLNFLRDVLTLIISIILIFYLDWKIAIFFFVFLPPFIITLRYFKKEIRINDIERRKNWAKWMGKLAENILGIVTIKSFQNEKEELNKVTALYDNYLKRNIRIEVFSTRGLMLSGVLASSLTFVLLWYGIYEIKKGALTIGTFFALYYFMGYLYGSVERLININLTIISSLEAMKRVMETLEEKQEDFTNGLILDKINGKIEFRNVSFSYNGRSKVLKNVNIQASPGKKIVITGRSGSGKTTLALLLLRFIDPDEGEILLDGINLKKINLKFLREQISYISQDPYIFEGTIEENIQYGNPHINDKNKIIEAARLSSAHEFIEKLPLKYKTTIKESGTELSEGEKQRLAMARAFFKDSKIIIFDEAYSHLDYKNAFFIRKSLDVISKTKTVILITHRLSLISNSDKIYVIENGEIVETGTHKDLLLKNGIYKELYLKQYSDFKLMKHLLKYNTILKENPNGFHKRGKFVYP